MVGQFETKKLKLVHIWLKIGTYQPKIAKIDFF